LLFMVRCCIVQCLGVMVYIFNFNVLRYGANCLAVTSLCLDVKVQINVLNGNRLNLKCYVLVSCVNAMCCCGLRFDFWWCVLIVFRILASSFGFRILNVGLEFLYCYVFLLLVLRLMFFLCGLILLFKV